MPEGPLHEQSLSLVSLDKCCGAGGPFPAPTRRGSSADAGRLVLMSRLEVDGSVCLTSVLNTLPVVMSQIPLDQRTNANTKGRQNCQIDLNFFV